MRILQIAVFCAASSACTGCLAAALAPTVAMLSGSAVRSGAKKVDVVLGNGVTPQFLQSKKNLGISVIVMNDKTGQYIVASGEGATNASVYSDVLSKDLMKLNMGLDPRVIGEPISETTPLNKLKNLAKDGIDLILIGSMNISTTSNTSGMYLAGGRLGAHRYYSLHRQRLGSHNPQNSVDHDRRVYDHEGVAAGRNGLAMVLMALILENIC